MLPSPAAAISDNRPPRQYPVVPIAGPHLLADRMTGTVYVAGAIEDGTFTAEQAELLDRALTDAGVDHTIEFYPARHGFAVPDNDTYDGTAAERHWAALRHLYQAHLHG